MRLRHRAAMLTAVAGIALTGVVSAAPAMAATSATVQAGSVTTAGTVSALNALKGTVTVAGVSGSTNTITVAPNAAVTLDGDTSKLAKLPIGATVKLSGDTASVATRVDATSVLPFVSAGSVTAVTAKSVSVKRLGTTTTDVLPVADKAIITLDGRTVAASALPVGAHIAVTGTVSGGVYSAKLLVAVSRWSLNLSGTVSAVDAAAGTVTVRTGTPAAAVKLNVDPKANVQVNGVKVALANLPVGATVNLTGTETPTSVSIAGIDAKLAATKLR